MSDMLRIVVGYSRANHIVGPREQIIDKLSHNLDDLLGFLKQDCGKQVANVFEQQIILDTQRIRALVEFSSVNMDELKNYLIKRWSSISESPNNYVSVQRRNHDWGGGIEAWTILFEVGNSQ